MPQRNLLHYVQPESANLNQIFFLVIPSLNIQPIQPLLKIVIITSYETNLLRCYESMNISEVGGIIIKKRRNLGTMFQIGLSPPPLDISDIFEFQTYIFEKCCLDQFQTFLNLRTY